MKSSEVCKRTLENEQPKKHSRSEERLWIHLKQCHSAANTKAFEHNTEHCSIHQKEIRRSLAQLKTYHYKVFSFLLGCGLIKPKVNYFTNMQTTLCGAKITLHISLNTPTVKYAGEALLQVLGHGSWSELVRLVELKLESEVKVRLPAGQHLQTYIKIFNGMIWI